MNFLENATIKYHGLLNQGATCYLNSVLQVLFMTEEFREAVERHTCENPASDYLDHQLKDLFDDLKRYTAYTYKITTKLGIDRVYEQHDAAEYFEKILTQTSPDPSQIFHGQLTHKTICSKCETEKNTESPIWHLPLALMDSYSEEYHVEDGIKEFFRDSNYCGEDQMYCDQCDFKVDATVKCEVKHHPDVLMLLLKRFEFNHSYKTYVKNNRVVNVPFTLQLPENQTYELYAAVDHFGDLRNGNYTATIKSQDNERWYNFSDTRVTLLDYQPFQVENTEKSQSAYLLFYRKQTTHAADTCTQNIRKMSASGRFPPATSDNQTHDAEEIKKRNGNEQTAEMATIKYHGLLNQEGTSYLNSVLQVLFMTKEFTEAVERHTCENPDTEYLDRHLKDLFDDLQKDTACTNKITNKLGINRVYEQHNTAEYFEKILTQTSPDASQIFHGELTHKTICSKCETEKNTSSPVWHLPFALMNSYSEEYRVVDGIEEYFRDSHFSGQDQMYCDRCDAKVDVTIKCEVKHHPEVLVLLLKRFEFDNHYMRYVKIHHVVDVPSSLQIPENQTYELYAVVDHVGDLRHGHYAAIIKSQDDDRWYIFNDDRVTLLDHHPFHVENTEKSQSAVLLFYRKHTTNQDIREFSTRFSARYQSQL